jgi:DNA-binding NtrC family response regulator
MGSKNGTFYLGTRVEKAVLQRGAVLRLGHTSLMVASRHPPAGPGYSHRASYGALMGSSPAARRLYAALEQLEQFDYTVLILGETGVGKERVAREIHDHSRRAEGPFEVCDCAALSPTLVESELFGHTRGAFTGAHATYRGVFERAHGGTIFLDEIGELPSELQPKLLRVLETHSVRRLGGAESIDVDVRVVAATNRDLGEEVKGGRFREDLFFRLNLVSIDVPPLRERREDIPLLIRFFLEEMGNSDLVLSPSTIELFTTGYDWPGNVRELKNAVARAQAMGSLPEGIKGADHQPRDKSAPPLELDGRFMDEKRRIVNAFEKDYLAAKLAQCDNNISHAARMSGMERNQFKRLLRKHGLLDRTS